MSFLGAAECSSAANPLSQISKHVQSDKSLQRDRLVGNGPSILHDGIRSQASGGPQNEVCKVFREDDPVLFRRYGVYLLILITSGVPKLHAATSATAGQSRSRSAFCDAAHAS